MAGAGLLLAVARQATTRPLAPRPPGRRR